MKHIALTIAIATALASTATMAYADTKNGLYAGVAAGYSLTDLDSEAAPIGSTAAVYDQQYIDALELGVLVGYHHNLPKNFWFETEAEVFYAFGNEDGLFNSPLEVEKKESYSVLVKPGYQINESFGVFLALGWQRAKYNVEYAPSGYSNSEASDGFVHGIGVNYTINEHMSLTGEYNRVQISDQTFEHIPGIYASRFDPELDIFKVAMKYHF